MKSYMQPAEHHAAVQRVLALGRSGDPVALGELIAHLHDLRDLAHDPSQRDYVRAAALTTVAAIEQAARDGEAGVAHRCQRCLSAVSQEEHRQAQSSFQRTYCGRCYDAKFRIIGEFQIRPDFYLPEVDVYIEYWGLDTPQYKMSMLKKQVLYQQEGKRLISVYPSDLSHLDRHLRGKLALFGVCVGERSESAPSERQGA